MPNEITQAVKTIREGGIIIYPTESVYGLGCDPFNKTAVLRLLKIKRRHINKGLILIASSWRQAKELIRVEKKYPLVKASNNLPITWVFPATKKVPRWIRGKFSTVAIRVTLHPIAKKICRKFGGPIVSTSANFSCDPPIKSLTKANKKLISSIDFVVRSPVGSLKSPTKICDAKTGKVLRA